MANTLSFLNPPITEALLDIRVNLPKDTTLETLASFQDKVNDNYPVKKERFTWEGKFEFKPGILPEVVSPRAGTDGFFFNSNDGLSVAQVRLDGFTFNRLKPYKNWEEFRSQAKLLWNVYRQIAEPVNVKRIALRYINKIEIPLPLEDFKQYILTVPEVASNIPNELSEFFMRLVIENDAIQSKGIVTETIEQIKDGFLPLIFDIDVFYNQISDAYSELMWEKFEQLRNFKNQIFINSLTDKAKDLFR